MRLDPDRSQVDARSVHFNPVCSLFLLLMRRAPFCTEDVTGFPNQGFGQVASPPPVPPLPQQNGNNTAPANVFAQMKSGTFGNESAPQTSSTYLRQLRVSTHADSHNRQIRCSAPSADRVGTTELPKRIFRIFLLAFINEPIALFSLLPLSSSTLILRM